VFLSDWRAWLITVAMLATVTLTKFAAAVISGYLLGYSRAQSRVVFGLSVAQALRDGGAH
jgi:hypothetical protein